jgi:hypothetical protein
MAPIYLAQKSQANGSGPNIFKARGVNGYIPSTLSSLATVGLPHVRELAYDGYFRNIDAFLFATVIQSKVFCNAPGFTQTFSARTPIDIDHPDVSYSSKIILKPDQIDPVMNKIGAFAKEVNGKTLVFKVKKPDPKILDGLVRTCSDNFSAGPDSVTPIGYRAFIFIRDCISEFLAVHSYSAFSDKDLSKEGTSELTMLQHKKRVIPVGTYNMEKKARLEYTGPHNRYTLDGDLDPEEGADADKFWSSKDATQFGVIIGNPGGVVLKAKPSPSVTSNNFGPSSGIPVSPGLAFPYFPGMNTPDALIFKDITSSHFMRLLGRSPNEIQQAYLQLRRGFNSLATTQEGKMLAHMLAGIRLALQSQARLYVIYDGIYRGFCLLGAGFTIVDGAHAQTSLDYEILQKDLVSFNPHSEGLAGLLEALNLLAEEKRGQEDVYLAENLSTPKMIIDALEKLKLEDEDDDTAEEVKQINASIRKLQFHDPNTFRRLQPQHVEELLENIALYVPKDMVPKLPFKFTTYDAPYMDSLYRCLAQFGVEAPSPWNASGAEIRLEGTSIEAEESIESPMVSKKRKVEKEDPTSNVPACLIYSPKPVIVAWKDWKRVIERKAVKMDMKERARGYRCMVITDAETKKDHWAGLCKVAEDCSKEKKKMVVDKKDKGKKRATDIATYDDLLNMF